MPWQTIPVLWMTTPTPILLMTRPEDASVRFVESLPPGVLHCVRVCYSPLIRIQPTARNVDLAGVGGVIFTSANGVAIASGLTDRRDLPVFCVGGATARLARRLGWTVVCHGETANDMVSDLQNRDVPGPLVHFCGVHTRGDIAERLTNAQKPTQRQTVYDQELVGFSDEAKSLFKSRELIVAPVFSPRTARQFALECPAKAKVHLIALSAAVAKPLSALTGCTISQSAHPDADSIAALIESTVNHLCRVESGGTAQ